ncbi:MAG: endolytic transglycosylase MltG [Candidatus Aminicenantes bacterium]|nr:endolytic transglycosylase MltG [Candidatus Aminicenantes bacterium]
MILKAFKLALLSVNVLFFWLAAWFVLEYRAPLITFGEPVFFEVEKGWGMGAVARRLEEDGLIRRRETFLAAYFLFHSPRGPKAGEYRFTSPVRMHALLESLTAGRVHLHPVTVPEGLTGMEIASLLEEKGVLAARDFLDAFSRTELISDWDPEAPDLEGYLFPETYHFTKNSEADETAARMVGQFKSAFDSGRRRRAEEMGRPIRDIVILASLIEKETSLPEERELVSAVFHNRLKIGMKLDCDPTIIYALKREGGFDGDLKYRDLRLDNPYNTYRYSGLPPGPICNPGREALEAALFPASEPFLYFVSKNDGSHHFSLNYREHRDAVRKFQQRR